MPHGAAANGDITLVQNLLSRNDAKGSGRDAVYGEKDADRFAVFTRRHAPRASIAQ
jgi:hypothetical protein